MYFLILAGVCMGWKFKKASHPHPPEQGEEGVKEKHQVGYKF
jgi:hypothetical protein